ncbi:cobalt ABC transporter [Bifidobacterium pseudolongum subsp. globosum]|uniref:Cobalt ABC transporter n=1 Tax=Bifidobacterium pseudolongum subsp. globosum TaxID=1690 RepID=A0A2N3QIH4_9BIFI|nr:energy-coupling factor transporter ATPase [Bifidobacterium pseudolongum]PKU91281.1 cobalt ABC transporter [Bifidobacterium pseudolongum subsp. globosum]
MTDDVVAGAPIELDGVRFSYDGGATWVLDGVDLRVGPGERIALVGPNGAGKSTLARLIAGLAAPDHGTVRLMGHTVFDDAHGADADAYRKARRSIGVVFQNPGDQIVTTTVSADVAFGPENLGVAPALIGGRVHDALSAVGMDDLRDADPTAMSGGQQQRVAIAGMLAMDSRVLVLDEPTAMLDPQARDDVLTVIERVHQRGTAIVMVTHHPDEVAHADRVLAVEHGVVRDVTARYAHAHGIPSQVPSAALPDLPRVGRAAHDPAVVFDHVSFAYADGAPVIDDLTVGIERGSTVALVGPNGSGKTTFARLLCALIDPDEGTICVEALRWRHAKRRQRKALRRSLGLVMQRPERQLFAATVREDVAYGPRNQGLDDAAVRERVQEALDLVGIADLADRDPFSLSGGQQRLAAIAGVLACRPRVLVMDEPTASLDEAAVERVHAIMRTLHSQGVTILLITHDMRAAQQLADAMLVFGGRTPGPEASEPRIAPSNARYSVVSRLDPRAKIIGFLALMFSAFTMTSWTQLAVGCTATAVIVAASRLGMRALWRSTRMFVVVLLVMGLFNMLVVHSGTPLLHIGGWTLTTGGLTVAALYTIRFMLVIVLGAVIMLTTTPTALTDAFESMMSVFRKVLHVQEIALVMSLALRFLPTIADETMSIRDAQAARGGSIETGSPMQRVRAMCAVIVPIFAGVIRHADNLALALDARCYQEGEPRSHWHALHMHARDWWFLIGVAVVLCALALSTVFTI